MAPPPPEATSGPTCLEIERARRDFEISVVEYDPSQYGSEFPYNDRVRMEVTNDSDLTLPYLTAIIERYDEQGNMIGSSRAPSIPVQSVAPGDTVIIEHFFRGQMPQAKRADVRVEDVISPDVKQFFGELEGCPP